MRGVLTSILGILIPVIMQEDKPIAFYSRKLTETQKRYGVGEIDQLCSTHENEFKIKDVS